MNERELILDRIRQALTRPAPPPGHGSQIVEVGRHPQAPGSARAWLPRVGETFEERLALFQRNLADLNGGFQLLENRDALQRALLALREAEGWNSIATHAGELTDLACGALGLPVCRADKPYKVTDLEKCDVGLTECDALIAQTGSILLTSRSAGGRALSVLPPHHVVLARREQLLGGLPEAFELLSSKYAGNFPTFISLITGPSRTGDIERILVLGAHGPKKLTVFCV